MNLWRVILFEWGLFIKKVLLLNLLCDAWRFYYELMSLKYLW
jgi:hypothetical protein